MKKIKEAIKSVGKHTAYNSVGKSLPAALYEPKVPQILKVKTTDQK